MAVDHIFCEPAGDRRAAGRACAAPKSSRVHRPASRLNFDGRLPRKMIENVRRAYAIYASMRRSTYVDSPWRRRNKTAMENRHVRYCLCQWERACGCNYVLLSNKWNWSTDGFLTMTMNGGRKIRDNPHEYERPTGKLSQVTRGMCRYAEGRRTRPLAQNGVCLRRCAVDGVACRLMSHLQTISFRTPTVHGVTATIDWMGILVFYFISSGYTGKYHVITE